MPNYNAHIEIASETMECLDHPTLKGNVGSFLLGSTAPDIRIITRKKREDYHFASLDFEELGAGVEGLFHSTPNLYKASKLSEPTIAFVSGYLTHIIADEIWILKMYRPYFGNPEVFSNQDIGNLMDRSLQLDMDRQARKRMNEMQEARRLIEEARNGIDVEFIPKETLNMWRNWLLMALDKEFNWERLRFMARRIASSTEEAKTTELCERFLKSLPQGLDSIYQKVPESKVSGYRQETIQKSVGVVGDYLS